VMPLNKTTATPAARERRRIRTPLLAVAVAAWPLTLVAHPMYSGVAQASERSMGRASGAALNTHAMHQMSTMASAGSLLRFLGTWSLMLTAMMAPLLISPLRHVGERSLPRRRIRARLLFITSYAAVWCLGGLALQAVAEALERVGPAIAIATAVLWQLTPDKQRCQNRHHARRPLAAFGRKADVDALLFGANHAVWCFGSCWALMLLPLVFMTPTLAVMAAVALWMWAEQFDTPVAATWRLRYPLRGLRIAVAWTPRVSLPTRRRLANA
jgi:predicted metal-binding membrane protein